MEMTFWRCASAFVVGFLEVRMDLNWDVEELENRSSEKIGKILLHCGHDARLLTTCHY